MASVRTTDHAATTKSTPQGPKNEEIQAYGPRAVTGLHGSNLPTGVTIDIAPHVDAQQAGNAASRDQLYRWFFVKCVSKSTTATEIDDTAAEIVAHTTADTPDPRKALDAAPAWEITAPNVDAAQGEKNVLGFPEKTRGYNWRATKRPTSPGALGDGERATDARIVVAENATIEAASIVERSARVSVG